MDSPRRRTVAQQQDDFDPRRGELQPLTGSGRRRPSESDDRHLFDEELSGDDDSGLQDEAQSPGAFRRWRQRRLSRESGGPTETCLVLLTAYATIVGLWTMQTVMVPLVAAMFISTLLLPMLDLLTERPCRCCRRVWCPKACGACLGFEQRHPSNCCCSMLTSFLTFRLPRAIGILIVGSTVMAFFFAVGVIVQQSIMQFTEKLPVYQASFRNESTLLLEQLEEMEISPSEDQRAQLIAAMSEASRISSLAVSVIQGSTEAITFVTLVILYVIFILLGSKTSSVREEQVVLYSIERQLQLYVSLKVAISTLCGVAHALILRSCGIDLAAVFGVATALLNFIPTVGLTIAVALPLPIIWLAPTTGYLKLAALIFPYAMAFAVSNVSRVTQLLRLAAFFFFFFFVLRSVFSGRGVSQSSGRAYNTTCACVSCNIVLVCPHCSLSSRLCSAPD